jgi:hypothetical protein
MGLLFDSGSPVGSSVGLSLGLSLGPLVESLTRSSVGEVQWGH